MGIKVDMSGLLELRRQLVTMDKELDDFCRKFLLQMGLRVLALVKKGTPVDSGYLRLNWQIGDGQTVIASRQVNIAPKGQRKRYKVKFYNKTSAFNQKATINSIRREGNNLAIDIYNGADYASYVESGHVTVGRNSWVPGRFMLRLSMEQIEREMPARFQAAFKAWVAGI